MLSRLATRPVYGPKQLKQGRALKSPKIPRTLSQMSGTREVPVTDQAKNRGKFPNPKLVNP